MSRPLRVHFGTIDPRMPGGIYPAERPLQEALAATGQVIVTSFPFGRRRVTETVFDRTVSRAFDLFRYAWRVVTSRPDVVQLNTAFDRRALVRDVGYALISRVLGQPLFLKFHGSDVTFLRSSSGFWKWLIGVTIRSASCIGVLSSEERRNFIAAGFPGERVVVVKNPVNWKRFEDAGASGRRPGHLLFIARIVPGKRLDDVLRAVRILLDRGRQVSLTCVGDGPARPDAEALAGQLGLDSTVEFTGFVPEHDTDRFYHEAAMLVLPSESEGFSMTIFHAVAAGVPVLTTRIRAAADYLEEPANCLWVEAGNPAGLASRIAWLLDHPEVSAMMSANNRKRARAFGAERVAGEYVPIYESLRRGADRARSAGRP